MSRIDDLLAQMTLEEKISMLAGTELWYSTGVKRLGIPDRFIEHGERHELLADCGLDAQSIAKTCREMLIRQTEGSHA